MINLSAFGGLSKNPNLALGFTQAAVKRSTFKGAEALRSNQIDLIEPTEDYVLKIDDFVNEHIAREKPISFSVSVPSLVATNSNDEVVGCIILQPTRNLPFLLPGQYALGIHSLVVAPEYRGLDFAAVILQMAVSNFILKEGRNPERIYGGCEAGLANFYQKLGFDITKPGHPMPGGMLSSNRSYPCFFYRFWSVFDNEREEL